MKQLLKNALLLLGTAALLAFGAGCKTAEGFGEDVEDAGESIQRGVR
jgi:predicted small secreted protein